MPFYEYQCKSCGHSLEAMQKVNDLPLKKCPDCGKPQLMRLMSAPVFRLKGAGWYETDFKGDKDKKKNLADRPEGDAPKEEAKGADAKTAEAGAAASDAPKTAEKAADKTNGKAADGSSGKAERPAAKSGGGSARRAPKPAKVKPAPARPAAKKMVKKAAAKSKRRA